MTATRDWTFKYWKARVLSTLSNKSIKPPRQNSVLNYPRLSKWLKSLVKVPTNLGTPANILSGECPVTPKLYDNR